MERQSRHHAPARSKVLLREDKQRQLTVQYCGRALCFTGIEQRPGRRPAPPPDHPWKQSFKTMQAA